jgi:Zn ribbon nucleic-acid-binding protein
VALLNKWDGTALVNTDQSTPRNIPRERRTQVLVSQKRHSSKSKMVGWLAELSFLRFIAKKVCTACSKTNKIVPLTNVNKCVYNDKSETEVFTNNSSEKIPQIHYDYR